MSLIHTPLMGSLDPCTIAQQEVIISGTGFYSFCNMAWGASIGPWTIEYRSNLAQPIRLSSWKCQLEPKVDGSG